MKKRQQALACLVVLSLLTIALVPQEPETKEEEAITLGVPALALPLAVALGKEVAKYTLKQVIAAAVVGAAAGWLLHEYVGSGLSTETENLKAQARAYEADIIQTILQRDSGSILRSIDGFADLWEFTLPHWMRQAEVAAVELWTPGETYTDESGARVLALSGLMVNLAQFFENIEYGPDSSFELLADRLAMWRSNQDTYGPMSLAIRYGSTALSSQDYLDLHICNAVYNATNGQNTVWLDNRELWVFGQSFTTTVTLDDGTAATYHLQPGYNDLTTLQSTNGQGFAAGYYTLPAGRSYAGSLVPAVSSSAAIVSSAAVIESGHGRYSLAVYQSPGIDYLASTNYAVGNRYQSLDILVTQDSSTHYTIDLLPLLAGYQQMLAIVKTTLEKANIAAAAAWDVFSRAGAANLLLSPSSLVPPNAEVSRSELYVLTAMAMQQLAEYTAAAGQLLNEEDYRLSPASLQLVLRGDIYDAGGTLLYQDVLFSPYVWLYDQSFTAATTVTLRQSALLAIWGNAGEVNEQTIKKEITSAGLLAAAEGYRLNVKEIKQAGESVKQVTLEVFAVGQWHEYEGSRGSGGWDFSSWEKDFLTPLLLLLAAVCIFFAFITKRGVWLLAALLCAFLALTGVLA